MNLSKDYKTLNYLEKKIAKYSRESYKNLFNNLL